MDWKKYEVFAPLTPSSPHEVESLQREACKEAKRLLATVGREKAVKALKNLSDTINIRKIACDMYVWERVRAIDKGIAEALS